jgi:hypothetical protein
MRPLREKTEEEERDVAVHEVYMDDRTWAAKAAKSCIDPVRAWAEFSDLAILQENPTKIQLTGRTPQDKRELEEEVKDIPELRDKMKPQMEVLGMETVGSAQRRMTKKENKRLDECKKTLLAIQPLPVGQKLKQMCAKMLGLSKATYGWIARRIPGDRCNGMFACAMRTIGGAMAYRANRHLKAVVFGGGLHLTIVTATRALMLLQSMRRRCDRVVEWHKRRGSIVATVRQHMKALGLDELGELSWKGQLSKMKIVLRSGLDKQQHEEEKGKWSHFMREEWRRREFQRWTQQKKPGRIQREARNSKYSEERITMVRQKLYGEDGTGMTVMWERPAVRQPRETQLVTGASGQDAMN